MECHMSVPEQRVSPNDDPTSSLLAVELAQPGS